MGRGVFVLSWRLLNKLLSLHTFITERDSTTCGSSFPLRNVPFVHHDGIRPLPFSIYARTCVTHIWLLCDCVSCTEREGRKTIIKF